MAREYDNAIFAENLKEIRKYQVRITQEQLAELSGIDLGSIARYETGNTTPGLENAFKLASALGVTLDDLCPIAGCAHVEEPMTA